MTRRHAGLGLTIPGYRSINADDCTEPFCIGRVSLPLYGLSKMRICCSSCAVTAAARTDTNAIDHEINSTTSQKLNAAVLSDESRG
jgi:hypothetical protein